MKPPWISVERNKGGFFPEIRLRHRWDDAEAVGGGGVTTEFPRDGSSTPERIPRDGGPFLAAIDMPGT